MQVKAEGNGSFPPGSRVVVVLAEKASAGGDPSIIGGNSVPVSKTIKEALVTITLEPKINKKCSAASTCIVIAQIVKGSSSLFQSAKPAPFKVGQGDVVISVLPQ